MCAAKSQNSGKMTTRLSKIGVFLSLSGPAQFGYLASVFNQPQITVERFINASYYEQYGCFLDSNAMDLMWSGLTAILILGMFIAGAFFVRPSLDRLGRKGAVSIMCILLIIGGVISSLAQGTFLFQLLFVGRLISGIGCGFAMISIPVFLSEVAPASVRGTLCALIHFGFSVGALVTNILGLEYVLGTTESWPWLFLVPLILPVICLVIVPMFFPETPKFLFSKKRRSDLAADSLAWYHGENADLGTSLQILAREHELGEMSLKALLQQKNLRKMLFVVIAVAVCGTFDGSLALYSYIKSLVLNIAGRLEAEIFSFIYLLTDIVFGIPSFTLIDTWGRRPLILLGTWGVCVALAILCISTVLLKATGNYMLAIVAVMAIEMHLLVRTFGFSKILLMLETELFPTQARSAASCFRSVLMDLFNMIILFTFYVLYNSIGGYVFLILLAFVAVGATYLSTYCPETATRAVADIVENLAVGGRKSEEEVLANPEDEIPMRDKVPDSSGRSPISVEQPNYKTFL